MKRAVVGTAAVLILTSSTNAASGELSCSIEHAGGLTQKIITYKRDGKVYAVNGQARQRAGKRGWIDGKTVFSPEQMLDLLREGLKKC